MTVTPDRESRRFEIEGHDLGYPAEFRDGSSLVGLFLVSSRRADELLAGSGFRAAEVLPRRSVVSLNCVHYTDTDCGSYDEVAFAAFVRSGEPSRVPYLPTWRRVVAGDVASHSWRLAVTSRLSRDAGIRMWGFPKTVEDLRYEVEDGQAAMSWHADGGEALRFSVPARGRRTTGPISPPVYSVHEGRPHVGYLTQSYTDVGYHVRGARLELGDHPAAAELRRLGVRRRPLLAVWNGHLHFRMSAPVPLD